MNDRIGGDVMIIMMNHRYKQYHANKNQPRFSCLYKRLQDKPVIRAIQDKVKSTECQAVLQCLNKMSFSLFVDRVFNITQDGNKKGERTEH